MNNEVIPNVVISAFISLFFLTGCSAGGSSLKFHFPDPPPDPPGSTLSIFDYRGTVQSSEQFNALESQSERDGSQASTVGPDVGRVVITPGGPADSILVILPTSFQSPLSARARSAVFDNFDRIDELGGTFDIFVIGSVESGFLYEFTLLNTDFGGSGLDYTTFGIWEWSTFDTDTDEVLTNRATALAFGSPTAAGDMPSTGSASYSGRMNGSVSDSLELSQPANGVVSLMADFLTADISMNITGVTVGGQVFRDLSGNGSITNNTFVGTDNTFIGGFTGLLATDPIQAGQVGPDMNGSFQGNFFGPAAEEIGGVLEMSGGGAVMSGAFVGAQ
jgi:hypothetical protein